MIFAIKDCPSELVPRNGPTDIGKRVACPHFIRKAEAQDRRLATSWDQPLACTVYVPIKSDDGAVCMCLIFANLFLLDRSWSWLRPLGGWHPIFLVISKAHG